MIGLVAAGLLKLVAACDGSPPRVKGVLRQMMCGAEAANGLPAALPLLNRVSPLLLFADGLPIGNLFVATCHDITSGGLNPEAA